MRRLSSLTSSLLSSLPNSPSARHTASSSLVQDTPPSLISLSSFYARTAPHVARRSLACGVASFATVTAASTVVFARHASSSNSPAFHFTSFELESELLSAQEDLHEHETPAPLPTASRAPQPQLSVTADASAASALGMIYRALKHESQRNKPQPKPLNAKHSHAAKPAFQQQMLPATQAKEVAFVVLPSLLRGPRWRESKSKTPSVAVVGYLEAAQEALAHLRTMWMQKTQLQPDQRGSLASSHDSRPDNFAHSIARYLRLAHVDTLLVLLELVLSPPSGAALASLDGAAHDFRLALLPCLLQCMLARHIEVTGAHMAHVSRLLLSCDPLFADSAGHAEAWSAFAGLCYATRRRLRRKHNRDCLEALLWGLYHPQRHEARRTHQRVHSSASSYRRGHSSPYNSVELARQDATRKAALHHLLYRCLETEPAARLAYGAAAHVEVVLAWSLLLGGGDIAPFMQDAIVHRLCKTEEKVSRERTSSLIPAFVRQWKRLALRRTEAERRDANSEEKRGRHGKALRAGSLVYTEIEEEARRCDNWSVPAMDRFLLAVLYGHHATSKLAEHDRIPRSSAALGEVARVVSAAPSAQAQNSANALRLADATRTTLCAYAQLRWGSFMAEASPLPTVVERSVPQKGGTRFSANSQQRQLMRRQQQAACEEEMAELVHTAFELPKHACCLSEAMAGRLVRCLRLHATICDTAKRAASSSSAVAPKPNTTAASSLSQRQVAAAFRRLARHSRPNVLTHLLVLQDSEYGALPAHVRAESPSAATDALSLPAFTRAAIQVVIKQLHTADEAAQLMEEWWHERRVACTALPQDVLCRLHRWVEALPRALLSQELKVALEKVAELSSSLPPTAAPAQTEKDPACSLDNSEYAEAQQTWAAILAAATSLPNAEEASLITQSEDAPNAALRRVHNTVGEPSTGMPVLPAASLPFVHVEGTASRSPHEQLLLRRLQWMALVNASARLEWRWCGTPRQNTAAAEHSTSAWSAQCALVEASEAAEMSVAEYEQLKSVCLPLRANDNAARSGEATSEAALPIEWQWINKLLTCSEAAFDAEAFPGFAQSFALSLHTAQLIQWAALTERFTKNKQDGPNPIWSDERRASPIAPAEYEDALRVLSAYCDYIVDEVKHAEGEHMADSINVNKLRCAAAMLSRCYVAFWQECKGSPHRARAQQKNSDGDFFSVLCTYYKRLLQLYSALAQHTALTNDALPLPPLPDDLQLDVFRYLTRCDSPDWQQCKALLILADGTAALCLGAVNRGHSQETAFLERPGLAPRNVFSVPLAVYAEVVAAHVARQQPISQQLLERCAHRL